jgi:hypothetical protein
MPFGCTIGSLLAFAMSRTFWPSVASRCPTKRFEPGVGSLDQHMLARCGGDKVGSVTYNVLSRRAILISFCAMPIRHHLPG